MYILIDENRSVRFLETMSDDDKETCTKAGDIIIMIDQQVDGEAKVYLYDNSPLAERSVAHHATT